MRTFGTMDREEGFHFLEDAVERARLVTACGDRVAMHRVTRPDDLAAFTFNSTDELWQMIADLVVTETSNERQTTCFVFWVEDRSDG